MKTIIDDKIPYIRGEIEALLPNSVYLPGGKISANDVKDADVLIIRTRTHCDRNLLEGSKVKLIVTATIGYDHIDTTWCESHGIEWHNCPGCNANSVATYIKNSLSILKSNPSISEIGTLSTIGIIGKGHVGSIVNSNCIKSGLRTICHDPFLGMNNWDRICQEADIITFHVPLTHNGEHPTYHMANQQFFDSLQRRPVIINTSRGGVIDEPALLDAIDSHKVRGTIIDTWENEPDINLRLLSKALIATPHIAGYSANGKMNATNMVIQHVAQWLERATGTESPNLTTNYPLSIINCQLSIMPLASLTTSTLLSDSLLLKTNPQDFESFRSNYPQRVE